MREILKLPGGRVLLLSMIITVAYLGALSGVVGRSAVCRARFYGLGLLAIAIHGYLLHTWIDLATGQNLSLVNIISMTIWLAAVGTVIASSFLPLANLSVAIFPMAIISVFFVLFMGGVSGELILPTAEDPRQLFHILLSLLAASVVCMAGLQAGFAAVQQRKLKLNQGAGIMEILPSLQRSEQLLFRFVWLAFGLLSLLLLTSFLWLSPIFSVQVLPKAILTLLSWLVFAVLLWGHYLSGWRGLVAIRLTLFDKDHTFPNSVASKLMEMK